MPLLSHLAPQKVLLFTLPGQERAREQASAAILEENKATIGKPVSAMFSRACPGVARTGDEEACFLAIAHYGAFHVVR